MEAKHHPPYFLPVLTVLAVLSVIVPFGVWRQTWFGRNLSPEEIDRYLHDNDRPRRMQHAMLQISDRILQGDSSVARWYPPVVELSRHPKSEIRTTAAWVMGQDNRSEAFHRALLILLGDPHPMVRRNAALSLVRFNDSAGRAELLKMLEPDAVLAPASGQLLLKVGSGQEVGTGTLLARLGKGGEEIRSEYAGKVDRVLMRDGSPVEAGEPILLIQPGADQVWEALRALCLIGLPEDLNEVERYGQEARASTQVQQQATLTAQAIRTRSERKSIR